MRRKVSALPSHSQYSHHCHSPPAWEPGMPGPPATRAIHYDRPITHRGAACKGKDGVGIVNLAFDGWETTTPVEWTNIYFFFVIGVCFKQWCRSQLQSRDNFELSAYRSFAMWYDVRWFHLELFYLENFVFVSFGLYVGILCSGHWTVEKSCFCFLNLEIGLFDQIHFPSPTLQPGPSG